MKSGTGINDVYKPKLVWFGKAEAFWRESSSNLDLSSVTQRSTANVYDYSQEKGDQNDTSGLLGLQAGNPSQDEGTRSTSQSFKTSDEQAVTKMGAPETPKKLLKAKTPKKAASRFEKAVSKLHEIAEMTNGNIEDQYSSFGNHVASQLREVPLTNFIILQKKIKSLITQERLAIFQTLHPSPIPHSPPPGTSTLPPSPSTYTVPASPIPFVPSPCASTVQDSLPSISSMNNAMITYYTAEDSVQATYLRIL
ncbi:hypothetical protein E2C01_052443 [Portunus trituberculatus]|uniref:BESS domain-containing protein n=1 Tax=Portunus trituberculatus TaxID=210409 RepID=A0A5B7GN04_PORTR|nr:hypothetical protein [Portunus trituberculatus]